MGSATGPGIGFVFDNERAQHPVSVPEFEIDAQPVTWAQYVEFVGDGGYDHPEFWDPAGWQWLQSEGQRGPRYVEQIGVASGAVVQTRFGNAMRMLGHQPAMHMSWWEADAWCRWAGRKTRLTPAQPAPDFDVDQRVTTGDRAKRRFRRAGG